MDARRQGGIPMDTLAVRVGDAARMLGISRARLYPLITSRDAANVYVTLNPIRPELRARANNRLRSQVKATAADADVLHRRHLLFDIDPRRPADIAATDDELAAALHTRDSIEAYLVDL